MKKLLLCWILATVATTTWAATTVKADLAGDGQQQTYKLEIKQTPQDEHFSGGILRFGQETKALAEDFSGFAAELAVFSVSGDKGRKVLMASAMGESDYIVRYFFGIVDGKLKQVGRVDGQGEVIVPGNGTVVAKSWMGFWSKTDKHVFGPDLSLKISPQEFYSVDVEGTVLNTFPVYQTREGKAVLANTREGSKFKVLLWDPASRKVVGGEENYDAQWYLIRTESGFTGWVRTKHLMGEFAQLPWAG